MKRTALLSIFLLLEMGLHAQSQFKTINFLNSIKGQYILSGQHNDQKNLDPWAGSGPTNQIYWTEKVHEITGKYPALYGGDFLFHGNSNLRWDMTYEAERQWNAGAVVNIMWHACPPVQGDVCQWDGGLLSSLSSSQWDELLTNGSNLNNIWKARMDDISVYLQYLKNKGVEVLWRPLHEQNQTAFWWNSRDGASTAALWRLTHDYMTNVKGLSNLIWVWDVQDIHSSFAQYNPGSSYFDMMALDVYADGYSNTSYYNAMLGQAAGKPVAFGECFKLPTAQQISSQSQMTFFMNWAYGLHFDWAGNATNSDNFIREVYNNPKVLTRDEMPGWNVSTVPNLATGKNVVVSSTEAGANIASRAVDGSTLTRWSSLYTDSQWIYVDLAGNYNINNVVLNWEAAYGKKYDIQISSDANNWTTVFTESNGNGGIDNINVSGTGRYVRMRGIQRNTAYGYSLFEFEIRGSAAGDTQSPSAPSNLQVTGTTSSSVSLSWGASSDNVGVANYQIYGATNNWLATVTSTNATISGLQAATNYPFIVRATDAAQNFSAPSNQVNATTTSVQTNIALNKPVSVSSTESGGNVGANAVDGNVSSRWSSLYADPQWIRIDLGAVYSISRVVLNWEAAYGKAYYLETSLDGVNWSNMFSEANGNGGIDDINTNGTGRYVRMYGTQRNTVYGYSLYEFQVYGTLSTGGGNIAIGKSITASSTESGGNIAANAIDGNGSTRWSSGYLDGQSITVDLGSNYSISRVVLKWEAAYANSYQVQISSNNSTWTTIYSDYTANGGVDDLTLSGTGRYVKVYGLTRATAFGMSLWEFEIYGNSSARVMSDVLLENTEDQLSSKISVYPNPTYGKDIHFSIDVNKDIKNAKVKLISMMGQVVYESDLVVDSGRIDSVLSSKQLNSGMYVLHIAAGNTVKSSTISIR